MGLRYRKQIKLLPGVKLNISKSGVSTSVGKPGNTVNVSRRGVKSTIGLPGTGLSYSQMLTKGRRRVSRRQSTGSTRQEMKLKYGLNDHEIDRLLKLYKKKPRKFISMSEQEMIAYAKSDRFLSGRISGKLTIGSRFIKFTLVIVLIVLVLTFLASSSHK